MRGPSAALLVIVWGAAARAQDATPPRPERDPVAEWPAGEPAGSAAVGVVVEVDAGGRVVAVSVERSVSPAVDAAAVSAVRSVRFSPARRAGRAVRGVARLDVPVVASGSRYETVVTARAAVHAGASRIEREQIATTPGTMGDPFRVIETLPGVMPILTGVPYYYIRGAPPADTGNFLDGTRVPALFHVALGPSVVHPSLIDRVDFWAGGAPARFPGTVGGVVAATSAPLPRDRPHLDVDVRLVDAGGIASVPWDRGRTRASVSGRYSYTAAILSAVSPGVELDYWDYQVRLERDLGGDARASIFVLGSHDFTRFVEDDEVLTDFAQEFHRATAAVRLGPLEATLGLGWERLGLDQGFEVAELTLTPRVALHGRLGADARIAAGLEATWAHSDLDRASFAIEDLSPDGEQDEGREFLQDVLEDADVVDGALWAEARIRAAADLSVVPGVRAGAIGTGDDVHPFVDPRLSIRWDVSRRLAALGSAGLYHQRPTFLIPLPGLDAGDLARGLQRSVQVSEGVQWQVPGSLGVSLEAQLFFHRYENLSDVDFANDGTLPPRLDGNAYGLELLARRSLTARLSGWIAYTLSRNERHFPGGPRPDHCPTEVVRGSSWQTAPTATAPSEFDRTHILNVVASYLLPGAWRAGARLQVRSGHPYTRSRCELDGEIVYDTRNGERTPPYVQLDLRVDKTLLLSGWDLELYLEVINATVAADVISMRQDLARDGSTGRPRPDLQVPIVIPTLGARGRF